MQPFVKSADIFKNLHAAGNTPARDERERGLVRQGGISLNVNATTGGFVDELYLHIRHGCNLIGE